MTRAPSWSQYERALRAGLHDVSVELREMRGAGGEYDPKRRRISLDAFNTALLDGLIHELLHHVHYHRLAAFGAGEEPVTLTLEDEIVRWINRSPQRQRWWRNALKAKLSEGAE